MGKCFEESRRKNPGIMNDLNLGKDENEGNTFNKELKNEEQIDIEDNQTCNNQIKNENIIKENEKNGSKNLIKTLDNLTNSSVHQHYIIGHKISLSNTLYLQEEINNKSNIMFKEINNITSEIKIELKIFGQKNVPNSIRFVKGNIKLNDIEKTLNAGDYIFDRGTSIKNLNKTLLELQNNQNTILSFYLMKKSDKLIKDLEESEINFVNIAGRSCYQSATIQGFIHILFPIAIKNINYYRQKKGYKKIENLDELKNNSEFNNTVIDTIEGILKIQKCGNGGFDKNGNKCFRASKLFDIAPPILLGGQDINNVTDISSLNKKEIDESKLHEEIINDVFEQIQNIKCNPPSFQMKENIAYKMFTGLDLVKPIEIRKKTIISEILKFKIEESNKYYGNIVLKFNENDIKDENLDICKLIEHCPQIINKKIIKTSDVLFLITDRILPNDTIRKNFIVYEKLNFLNLNEWFELKFVIYHNFYSQNSGHYIAYSKFRGEWHKFNDCHYDYSEKEEPPLYENTNEYYYPISFYYVKTKKDD